MYVRKKYKWHTKKHRLILFAGFTTLIVIIGGLLIWRAVASEEPPRVQTLVESLPPEEPTEAAPTVQTEPEPTPAPKQAPSTTSQYPIQLTVDQANSITAVVNKKHKLPSNFAPSVIGVRGGSLRSEAAVAIGELLAAAEATGINAKIVSSYRSFSTQTSVYNNYVNQYGQARADTFSARPGHSEHQTGLAVDVGNANGDCELEICFGATVFGEWLKTNAATYGFIIRYPAGKEAVTGYQYEPWHLRYVGQGVALDVASSGKTLDEYYGVLGGGY